MQGEPLEDRRVRGLLSGNPSLAEVVLSWNDAVDPHEKQMLANRTIWGRMTVVPETVVRKIAGRLAPYSSTDHLVLMTMVGVGGYASFFFLLQTGLPGDNLITAIEPKSLPTILSGMGLFLLTGLWHEIGHATALAREGYAPGRIGLGFLLVIPVFFAEVTAVGMLARKGRLRVDVAGMVFQLMAGGAMMVLSIVSCDFASVAGALNVAAVSSMVAVIWSMLPFVRSDGYWVLADYLEVTSLDVPWKKSGSSSRSTGVFMVLFRVANIGFLVLLGVMIPLRLVRWLRFWGWCPEFGSGLDSVVLKVLLYFVLLLIWAGLGRHGFKLGRVCWQDLSDLKLLGK